MFPIASGLNKFDLSEDYCEHFKQVSDTHVYICFKYKIMFLWVSDTHTQRMLV